MKRSARGLATRLTRAGSQRLSSSAPTPAAIAPIEVIPASASTASVQPGGSPPPSPHAGCGGMNTRARKTVAPVKANAQLEKKRPAASRREGPMKPPSAHFPTDFPTAPAPARASATASVSAHPSRRPITFPTAAAAIIRTGGV